MTSGKDGKGTMTMAKTEFNIEPGTQEIFTTRVFDAPRELVFKVMTDPNLVPNWWGPRYLSTVVDKMDVRPGGSWRFVQRDAAGNEYAFHGVYHLIDPPRRVVQTFEFEGAPGHVVLETMTLEEVEGRTRMVQQSVFQSVGDRDAKVEAGMQKGAGESMDRLAEILAELSRTQHAG